MGFEHYNAAMDLSVTPAKLAGTVRVPASKSHTIRALILATLADGESTIKNPLVSEDTEACLAACRAIGARVETEKNQWRVRGSVNNPRTPDDVLDVGNSGTSLYLLTGIAALQERWICFTGDSQIRSRSASALLDSLEDLGAKAFSLKGNGCAPYLVGGCLEGGVTSIECPTSQYLSSLLLAAPLAKGPTTIDVPLLNERPYVEITLSWLDRQNISYKNADFKRFTVPGGQRYSRFEIDMPGDFSSATFFLCAAALTGSNLTVEGLDMTDSQGDKAVVGYLEQMGCDIQIADFSVLVGGGGLKGCDLDLNATPDALPAMAATACFAEGTTRLLNVPQARLKETDRISVMTKELTKLGARIEELEDGMVIRGGKPLHGTQVEGHGDHRVVMALAIAGLGARGVTTVSDSEAAAVTFPDFSRLLKSIQQGEQRTPS